MTLDLTEIILTIVIALTNTSQTHQRFGYFLIAFIIFIFLKIAASFIFLNVKIVKRYKWFFAALSLLAVGAVIWAAFTIHTQQADPHNANSITSTKLQP